jgi:glycosyltransferase involved in cell wall biosynthesis
VAKKKIVFLYTEIAEYFLAGCKALLAKGVEIHVVRYPVNKEAPFQFRFPAEIRCYERNNFDDYKLTELVNFINPDAIICSGWIDKGYNKVCSKYVKTIPVVVIIDNQWRGTLKQRIASLFSSFIIRNKYSHAFVPGSLQFNFARRLGFKENKILTGFYTADVSYFYNIYKQSLLQKQQAFPKRFLYAARYYEFKGINDLWQAFIELQKEEPNEWELWCLGTGDIEPIHHPKIKHFGFVQPKDLAPIIKDTGVFVLPSHFEPWGVVVHEYTAAGMPIICSDETGSRTAFVEHGKNGFIFKAGDVLKLKRVLRKTMNLDDLSLFKMGKESTRKALNITPETWADSVNSLLINS